MYGRGSEGHHGKDELEICPTISLPPLPTSVFQSLLLAIIYRRSTFQRMSYITVYKYIPYACLP